MATLLIAIVTISCSDKGFKSPKIQWATVNTYAVKTAMENTVSHVIMLDDKKPDKHSIRRLSDKLVGEMESLKQTKVKACMDVLWQQHKPLTNKAKRECRKTAIQSSEIKALRKKLSALQAQKNKYAFALDNAKKLTAKNMKDMLADYGKQNHLLLVDQNSVLYSKSGEKYDVTDAVIDHIKAYKLKD